MRVCDGHWSRHSPPPKKKKNSCTQVNTQTRDETSRVGTGDQALGGGGVCLCVRVCVFEYLCGISACLVQCVCVCVCVCVWPVGGRIRPQYHTSVYKASDSLSHDSGSDLVKSRVTRIKYRSEILWLSLLIVGADPRIGVAGGDPTNIGGGLLSGG